MSEPITYVGIGGAVEHDGCRRVIRTRAENEPPCDGLS